MKLITDLLAHIEDLQTNNLGLADEVAKVRDFFEGRASADGAARTKAENSKLSARIQELHAKVDATVAEANDYLQSIDDGSEAVSSPDPVETAAPVMRAKMLVSGVKDYDHAEGAPVTGQFLDFVAVGGDKVQHGYPSDGVDEDNTFARWSPSGSLSLNVVNPSLIGKIKPGEKYYLDFTLANPAPVAEAAPASPEPNVVIPGGVEVAPESIPAQAPEAAPVNPEPAAPVSTPAN